MPTNRRPMTRLILGVDTGEITAAVIDLLDTDTLRHRHAQRLFDDPIRAAIAGTPAGLLSVTAESAPIRVVVDSLLATIRPLTLPIHGPVMAALSLADEDADAITMFEAPHAGDSLLRMISEAAPSTMTAVPCTVEYTATGVRWAWIASVNPPRTYRTALVPYAMLADLDT